MDYVEITNKKDLLSRYAGDYSRLKEMIDGLPEQVIDFAPNLADAWSIREQIAHLRMVLSIYTQHVDKHLEFVRRNIELFEKREA